VRAGVGETPAALVFAVAAATAILFFFDPATAGFYPPCLFRTFLGFQCPGCGSLRAVHQLLHGNLEAAWALNRPIFIAMPLALISTFLLRKKKRKASSS
jgi:hypothetical protein